MEPRVGGASLNGRCLARNAAVSLDNNVINKPSTVSFTAMQIVTGISLARYNSAHSLNSATLMEAIAETMTGVIPSNTNDFRVTAGPTSAAIIPVKVITATRVSTSSIIINYEVVAGSSLSVDMLRGAMVRTETVSDDFIDTNINNGGSTSSSSDQSSLSAGAIAGFVICASVGLVLFAMLVYRYFFLFKEASAGANKSSAVEINEVKMF